MLKAKARGGYTVTLTDNALELKFHGKEELIPLANVASITEKRSTYDLPFLEKTLIVYLASGGNRTIKRLPKKAAAELKQQLASRL